MEIDTLEKATEAFRQLDLLGEKNCIFFVMKDKQQLKPSTMGFMGAAAQAIQDAQNDIAWDGYLVNQTEKGIGLIPFSSTNPLLQGLKYMEIHLEHPIFISQADIENVKIKNLNLISLTYKSVKIKLKNGIKYEWMVANKEKALPYHEANFCEFINQYK